MKILIILLILSLSSFQAHGTTAVNISPTVHAFDYTEFNTQNQKLNNESGLIPGLTAGLESYLGKHLKINLSIAQLKNDVQYTGKTNLGNKHTTRTYENISYYDARISLLFPANETRTIEFFTAMRRYEWERDIRSKGNIAGLYEVYQWTELSAGVRADFHLSNSFSWSIEASTLHTGLINSKQPEIFVDLSSIDGGTTKLQLKDDIGGRIQFEVSQKPLRSLTFGLAAYYEHWEFGRSNTKATQGGTRQLTVTEPRSETRNFGIVFISRFNYF